MIKKCLWKGQRLNCSSIFKMHPTDRGMCCAFNKERADEMFKVSRYEEQIMYLTEQDKNKSHENADVPSWWVLTIHPHIFAIKEFLNCRYDPVPEAGKSKGLTLVLDAHSDLVTSSSIPDYFQAIIFLCSHQINIFQESTILILGIWGSHWFKERLSYDYEEDRDDSTWSYCTAAIILSSIFRFNNLN